MDTSDPRKKPTGLVDRRRFQGLAAAGLLSVGLGLGAINGAFAAPAPLTSSAAVTPVASPSAAVPPGSPADHGPGGPGGFLGPVATFLGISDSDLQTALAGNQTLTDVAVAHGKTAADLKAFLLAQDSARIDQLISTKFPQPGAFGPGGPGGRGDHGGPGGFFGADIPTFLGISASDYRTALDSGQTPAQIAVAHGKTAAELKTYLTDQLKTRLDADVAAGRITSQQEADRLSQSSDRIDQMINNTRPTRGPGPASPNSAPTATATSG